MSLTVRRAFSLAAVAMLALSFVAEPVFAQGATVGPAGGIPSTTAPSNSQGTPSGGTGVISTTRVGPDGSVSSAPRMNNAPMASTSAPVARSRRARHRARRHARPAMQSQSGTNGSAATYK